MSNSDRAMSPFARHDSGWTHGFQQRDRPVMSAGPETLNSTPLLRTSNGSELRPLISHEIDGLMKPYRISPGRDRTNAPSPIDPIQYVDVPGGNNLPVFSQDPITGP